MQKLSTFFTSASGSFAVIPGLAVLITKVGVPPGSSSALFSAVLECLGVLTLMICWLNKKNIAMRANRTIVRWAVAGIVIFLVCLFTYIFLYGYLVREVPNSDSVYFPLWPQGELTLLLKKIPSRDSLIEELGRDDVVKIIQRSSKAALLVTTLSLLALYQLIFIPLVISFGLVGIKGIGPDAEGGEKPE